MSTSVPPTGPTPPVPQPPAPPPAPPLPPTNNPASMPAPDGGPTSTTQPKEKKAKPKPVKPIDLKDEYGKANKDDKGGLSKSELKLLDKRGDMKDYDKDGDDKVSLKEYRAQVRKQNSFDGLDSDNDGKLSEKEMSGLRRVTSEADNAFDADGDGMVTKGEFNRARKKDVNANREARREEEYKALSKERMKELAKDERYDADGDGKVSLDEYHEGRVQVWKDNRNEKMNHLFEKAGAKDGSLDVKDAEAYKSYDADGDGKITKEEFKDGFMADRKAAYNQHIDDGEIADGLKKRLGLDEFGFGLNHIEKEKPKADGKVKGETIDTPKGTMVKRGDEYLSAKIIENYDKMVAAAKKDGVEIELVSGYRSYEEQQALYQAYLNGTGNLAAKPGESNHEDGLAMDVANNPGAYDWMKKNASKFGFHNLPSEPWHYSLDGH